MKRILTILAMFAAIGANAQFFAGVETKAGASKNVEDYIVSELSYFVGANAGYEFLNRFPVSIGMEYSKLHNAYKSIALKESLTSFRIPLTIGYCHYIRNFRPFLNIGAFVSVGNKAKYNAPVSFPGTSISTLSHYSLPEWVGYLGQIGVGYKLFDKLLISAAFEYNRPFNNELEIENTSSRYTLSYFYGANIGVKWYF
jgi:outer membrane protein W